MESVKGRESWSMRSPQGRGQKSNGIGKGVESNKPHHDNNTFNRNVTSFMEAKDLWKLFKRYGDLVDLYLASRRLRRGDRFGFARFRCIVDKGNFLRKLNTIHIGGSRLGAYIAFDRKNKNSTRSTKIGTAYTRMQGHVNPNRGNHGVRDNRSYKDAVFGGMKSRPGNEDEARRQNSPAPTTDVLPVNEGRIIDVIPSKEAEEFFQFCVIGEVLKAEYLDSLSMICEAEGIPYDSIKYLGGKEIMFCMGS